MRNSNSKDKYANQAQNRLMKTQVPPKPKQVMQSTQYNPNSATSNKRIDSSKHLPPKSNGVNFKIQQNMTQSKIYQAKEGLQLLKKRMQKTGMSRQRSGNANSMQKTNYAPQSLKKISSQNQKSKNLQNYDEQQQQIESKPSKKIIQIKRKASDEIQKKQPIKKKQIEKEEYVNQLQQVPISKNQDFYALLQRQMAKEANQKNIPAKNLNNNNAGKKNNNVIVDQNGQTIQLYQCTKGCGRMFNQQVLPKHQKVCEKVFQSKRKAFNSAAFRQVQAEGDFQKAPQPPSKKMIQTKVVQKGKQKIPKWKLQSAQLRGGLKMAKGQKLTAQQIKLQKAQNDMMVSCNYCGRKFNQTAAIKHIPFCQTKSKQMPKFNTTKKK